MGHEDVWNELSGGAKDVLIQLKKVVWDGNLASKVGKQELIRKKLAVHYNGYTVITVAGLILLDYLGKLEDLTK